MSSLHVQLSTMAVVAYFVGALPFGWILGKAKGVDLREHGSKNIGASNAGRVLGRRYFTLTLVLDAVKGLIPMALASALVHGLPESERSQLTYLLWIGVGVAAILGHIFPIYLKFHGGKGVATSAGVLLGMWPYFTMAGVLAITSFIVVLMLTKYISLGSISAAFTFVISYVTIGVVRQWDLTGRQLPLLVVACFISSLVVWRHRDNIARLRAGTENKVRGKGQGARGKEEERVDKASGQRNQSSSTQ